MPVAMTAADIQPIQPAWNSSFLYFGTAEVGNSLELTWNNITSEAVRLGYDDEWKKTATTLVIQVQPGWTIVPNDSTMAWSSTGSLWTAQLLPAVIQHVIDKNPPRLETRFTFAHPGSGRKN